MTILWWWGWLAVATAQVGADTDTVTHMSPVSPEAVEDTLEATSADSLVIDLRANRVLLYRQVKARYRQIRIEGHRTEFDWDRQWLGVWPADSGAPARVSFFDGDDQYQARRMFYHFPTGEAYLEDLRFREGEGFIHSWHVKKDSADHIYGARALYTTCDADMPHYAISAQKIKLIPQKYIISGPAMLTVMGVPTPLMIPFGFFPIPKRQASGIILPAYGESDTRGFFLRDGGFFWAINDYADLALTGDIYSFGSWAARLRSRYKLRYRFSGEASLAFAHNIFGDPELPDRTVSEDFYFRWQHRKERAANPNFDFSADVNFSSGNYLRLNAYDPDRIVTNTLQSSISFRRYLFRRKHTLSVALNHSQNTASHVMTLILPDASYTIRRIYPFSRWHNGPAWLRRLGTHYQWQFRNVWETPDSAFLTGRWQDRASYAAVHRIPFSTSLKVFKYISVSPAMTYRGFFHFYALNKTVDTGGQVVITRQTGRFRYLHDLNYSLGLTTRLYGFLMPPWGRVVAVRHTVQPSVSISATPDFSADPWNYYRYYLSATGDSVPYLPYETLFGAPSATATALLNFTLNNFLEAKIRTDDTAHPVKRRSLIDNFSLSGNYNLRADSFALSTLNWGARFGAGKLRFQLNGTLDPYAYDSLRRQPTYAWRVHQGVGHVTGLSASINYALATPESWAVRANAYLSYNGGFSYDPRSRVRTPRHLVNVRTDVHLTPRWRVSISSGYDFILRQAGFTSVEVYRDLHCWEMSFQIIPFGFRKSYHFRINVKASTLRDLKLEKRKDYFDFLR